MPSVLAASRKPKQLPSLGGPLYFSECFLYIFWLSPPLKGWTCLSLPSGKHLEAYAHPVGTQTIPLPFQPFAFHELPITLPPPEN